MAFDDADFSPKDMYESSNQWTPEQFKRKAELLRQAGKHENADWFDKKAAEVASKAAAAAGPPRAPDLTDQAVKAAFQRQMMASQIGQTRQSTFLTDMNGNKQPLAPLSIPTQAQTPDAPQANPLPSSFMGFKFSAAAPANPLKPPKSLYGGSPSTGTKTLLGR